MEQHPEALYKCDVFQESALNIEYIQRLISEMKARVKDAPFTLVLPPIHHARLVTCMGLLFAPQQLGSRGYTAETPGLKDWLASELNPFNQVSQVVLSLDIPKSEVRIETPKGYGVIYNLSEVG